MEGKNCTFSKIHACLADNNAKFAPEEIMENSRCKMLVGQHSPS
jgi:hypothetical protein